MRRVSKNGQINTGGIFYNFPKIKINKYHSDKILSPGSVFIMLYKSLNLVLEI